MNCFTTFNTWNPYSHPEACDSSSHLHLHDELGAIKAAASKEISSSRAGSNDATWNIWSEFCHDLACDPFLQDIADPLPLLQIFAACYRVGTLAPSHSQVKARTVEGALCAVGQTFTSLGYLDPRLQTSGKLDLRLHRQLQAYAKDDPPPHRVKPVPLQLLLHVVAHCYRTPDPRTNTLGQMIILGFFFLLQPGEYAYTANPDATPFRLCDLHLLRNNIRLDPMSCSEEHLHQTSHVALEFTTQKNGIRGELVGLGRSGHTIFCPVLAAIARVKHLRLFNAHPTTPLFQYFSPSPHKITTPDLTQQLCLTCHALRQTVGITAADISICSLCSSGAMALLCADVDPDKIQLLGQWRSNEMLRYLHVQALPIVSPLATLMVQHGFFSFIPNNRLPTI
jgi:hypothetical protein